MGNSLVHGNTNEPVVNLRIARDYISDEEYHRIYQAFSRFKKDTINYDEFCTHVLGGALIPKEQTRLLYDFCCAGSDGLTFENLLCSLVGLCRISTVQTAFIEKHKDFSTWELQPPLLTLPMKDDYISFYEVMSYVTHLSVEEIIELEKVFATINDRQFCKISSSQWKSCLADCYPASFTDRLFAVLDENNDEFIDFRELVCGVSTLCRAPKPSRLLFIAKIWDVDCDGYLSNIELKNMLSDLRITNAKNIEKGTDDKCAVVEIASWALNNSYLDDYLLMAEEIGHICLGLRPVDSSVELNIVKSFMDRTNNVFLKERNIVSSLWYHHWLTAVTKNRNPQPIDNSVLIGPKEDNGWSGKVACISSESSTLKVGLSASEYVAVPTPLWKAWLRWHGSARPVDIQFTRKNLEGKFFDHGQPGLELYPLELLFLGYDKKKKDSENLQLAPWACAQMSRSTLLTDLLLLCKSQLRLLDDECRLWLLSKENGSDENFTLLDDESLSLNDLKLNSKKINKFLLEVRDPNSGIWPEELRASLSGIQIKSYTRSARPNAVGLVNGGNFCYRNAALQCLARVTPLTEYLLNPMNIDAIKREAELCGKSVTTTLEYTSLLNEMRIGKKKIISPASFNEAIKMTSDMFECNEQHDCQEFVAFLIETLQNSVHYVDDNFENTFSNGPKLSKENSNAEDISKADKEWDDYLRRENSPITALFAGQLRSILICRACNTSSTVFEPFTSLSLPIGFDNTELFQVIVIRSNGSVPHRFGFLLSRDTTVEHFRHLISDATNIASTKMTLQGFLRSRQEKIKASYQELYDQQKLADFLPGIRIYAMELHEELNNWRLAAHRKLQYTYQSYLLGATGGCIPSRFGLPLIITYTEQSTGKELYEDVMRQMKRFMVSTPSVLSSRASDPCEMNSSGYPFTLSIVNNQWEWCGQCDALSFCRGCPIKSDESLPTIPIGCSIAVDWFPTALYLKYNHSQELLLIDDPSVAETINKYAAPSSLDECLRKFSCSESLEEVLYCDKCKRKTNKNKIMSLWRVPKYLIIHFKRFEYLHNENRMGKCKRAIDFSLNGFDISPYTNGYKSEKYDCIAIANHYGELSSGHFIAYARGQDEKWLLLNDCSVKEVPEDDVDKATAYLLFFECRSADTN